MNYSTLRIIIPQETDVPTEELPVPPEVKDASQVQGTDGENEGEDTIATFVTSAGQQLALYAVENSEDIFAVALYDESGLPPTNFQFLMK